MQSLEDKSRAGKGAVEGVLGPGAANNSTLGGSLITTIAFGVPASVIMAILLGAFIIQGIVPGPDMLIRRPKGQLDLTFSFVWVIIISNIITVAICFLFLKPLAKDNPSPWRHYYSHHSGVDLPGRLCREERF